MFNSNNHTSCDIMNKVISNKKNKRKRKACVNHEGGETRVDGEEHILEQWHGDVPGVIDWNFRLQNDDYGYRQHWAVEVLTSRAYWLIIFFLFFLLLLQVLHYSKLFFELASCTSTPYRALQKINSIGFIEFLPFK